MLSNFEFKEDKVVELDCGIKGYFQKYQTKSLTDLNFETHNNFFDIQFVVEGNEYIGIDKKNNLKELVPYDKDKDISFYNKPAKFSKVLLRQGDFAIVDPEDAHMPALETAIDVKTIVKKIVFKVPF
jgi:YhcH/YjgK/YiaL family protein